MYATVGVLLQYHIYLPRKTGVTATSKSSLASDNRCVYGILLYMMVSIGSAAGSPPQPSQSEHDIMSDDVVDHLVLCF